MKAKKYLIILTGESLFLPGQELRKENLILLGFEDLPPNESKFIRSSLKSFPNDIDSFLEVIDDYLRGRGFFEKYYSTETQDFPLQNAGRVFGYVDGQKGEAFIRSLFVEVIGAKQNLITEMFPDKTVDVVTLIWCLSKNPFKKSCPYWRDFLHTRGLACIACLKN